MMRQSINITGTGLWVVHLGLFQSKISQILEGRVWVSPHSLLLVLVAAPMLPLPLYQRQLAFNWMVPQHPLRNNFGLEHTRHYLQPKILSRVALVPTSYLVSHPPIQRRPNSGSARKLI